MAVVNFITMSISDLLALRRPIRTDSVGRCHTCCTPVSTWDLLAQVGPPRATPFPPAPLLSHANACLRPLRFRTACAHVGPSDLPRLWMHAPDVSTSLRHPYGDPWRRPATAAGGYDKWVLLQHVQHQIYFCNIQMKHLQHTSETVETLATYL
jgi:hypothetical protein